MHEAAIEASGRGRSPAVGDKTGRYEPPSDALASEKTALNVEAMASWDNEGGSPDANVTPPPLRVLVVEDDAVIALLYGEVLEGMGYEVCATVGGETAAVSAAIRCRPDLMLVDQRLSDGSGVHAVEAILATRVIPQVFVSGDPAAVRLLRPDAVVLRKPFHATELGAAIELALAEGVDSGARNPH